MVSSRLRLFYIFLLASITALGCGDDPSNVGLGFIDSQAGEPDVVILEPDTFSRRDEADFTGGFLAIGSSNSPEINGAARFLAGYTEDPDFGTIAASSRVRFIDLQGATDEFRNGTVSSVSLILQMDYAYGDTLTPLTLSLSEAIGDWNAIGARSDTVLTPGPELTQFEVSPTDDEVEIVLPAFWISANDALLRSETFSSDFGGFHIEASSGDAVVGFRSGGTVLRIDVPGDTLRAAVDQSLTSTSRGTISSPPGTIILQDGFDILQANVDFDNEKVLDNSIHHAIFRLETLSTGLPAPAGYSRPPIDDLRLIAITGEDENRTTLASGTVDTEGVITFIDTNLSVAMQNTVLGRGDLVRFEILADVADNTINVLFVDPGPGLTGPRLVLTVTEVIQ